MPQGDAVYQNLLQAPFPVAVLRGPEHVIALANPGILRAWRKGPEVVGLSLLEAMPALLGQPFVGYLDEVFRSGVSYEGRQELARLQRDNGAELEDVYFDFVYAALRNADGAIEGILVTAFDVTEYVETRFDLESALEEARQERERAARLTAYLSATTERLHLAQQAANIGVFEWQLLTGKVIWSPELYRLMGLAPGSVLASPEAWTAALAEEDRDVGWDLHRDTVASHGEVMEVEVRLRQPDGGARWVRVSSQLLYDDAGALQRVLGAVVDIQSLKEAAAVSVLALAEAERENQAKDQFLATMSHELRTPLNAMLGWATVLRQDHDDDAQLEHGLSIIERSARAQSRLVSDLLDVSRIISGKLRLKMTRTDAAVPILTAVEQLRPTAEANGVELVVELDPDLGDLVADAERMQQIVLNLLRNAVKFTKSGGRVSVEADRLKSSLVLSVEDTGPGIAADDLPTLFDRFKQVDSSMSRAHGGLGLGLAIVRQLAEAHGGTVSVHSPGLGRGATFTVSLPTQPAQPSESLAERQPPHHESLASGAPRASKNELHGKLLLIVDDDADSLDLHHTILSNAGASVSIAQGAARALQLIAESNFDAVISDIGMPEMDGYALMRELRSRPAAATLPGIALTAHAREEEMHSAFECGYDEHLTKPVEPAELVSTVARLIAQRPNRSPTGADWR